MGASGWSYVVPYQATGTHSILDVGYDDAGTVRPLTAAERQRWFGTDTPTRADFDHAHDDIEFRAYPPTWSGHCVVLYREGNPTRLHSGAAPETDFNQDREGRGAPDAAG